MRAGSAKSIRLSTAVLVSIGLFDLVTTLALLNLGMKEGNPFFASFAAQGPVALLGAKLAFLAGPVALLEVARKYSPKSAEQGTWIAAGAYFCLYAIHVLEYLIGRTAV